MKIVNTILLVLFSVIYFLKARVFLDPDFGWSVRFGGEILKSGFPDRDPFSYTMPAYTFVDHEWLTHVVMAKLYSAFGYLSLAVVFTLVAISILLICIRKTDQKFLSLQVLLLGSSLYPFFGIRPQVISWLFFVILLLIVQQNYWKKYSLFLPLLFLAWANLHGGFIAGVVVLLVSLFFKPNAKDRSIILLSILVTLINPYGAGLWMEIWVSLIDSYLRLYILEWRPIIFGIPPITLVFLAFALAFIYKYKQKFNLQELILFSLFFLAAVSSVRNLPLFIILAAFYLNKTYRLLLKDIGSNAQNNYRLSLLLRVLLLIILPLSFYHLWTEHQAAKAHSEELFFPKKAVAYLTKYLPAGQILSAYEWGGYLIWKLPEKKVFVDGRMASWRQKGDQSESNNALKEYIDLFQLRLSMSGVLSKYGIDTILLPKAWLDKKDKSTHEVVSKFIKELTRNSFTKIYQDNVSLLFVRKKLLSTADN